MEKNKRKAQTLKKNSDRFNILNKLHSILGSWDAIAKVCQNINPKTTPQSVFWWFNQSAKKRIPAEYVVAIEKATINEKGEPQLTREEIRPDVFYN